uniref:Putative secreted protein n=1 Tax=Anopheles darlingi TaxID=43151 RepID=A0A2M4DGK9_ANODA
MMLPMQMVPRRCLVCVSFESVALNCVLSGCCEPSLSVPLSRTENRHRAPVRPRLVPNPRRPDRANSVDRIPVVPVLLRF